MTTALPSSEKKTPAILPWLYLLAGMLAVIAIHLPWTTHPVAAFSVNAFDLAEWASLHPTTRAENPALLSSLYLRIPLVLLSVSIALSAQQLRDDRWRWIWVLVAFLVALRLNPPVEFYRDPTGVSTNEQHLGFLTFAGLAIVFIVALASKRLEAIIMHLQIIIWIAIAYMGWEGLRRSTNILETLQIELNYGAGIYVLLALAIGVIALSGWRLFSKRNQDE